ncbi:MAG: preprotein translocase subunit SecG [Ruminococcus sp.]|nr:preprotein translocase subunit SecG [Ruminococcus sp.]
MSAVEIILGALLLIASVVLIVVIILQEGNQQGIGVVSGGADTFFSKNKARSYDAFLSRATKWFAIGFVVVVLALNIIAYFAKPVDTDTDTADDTSISEVVDATADEA